jgi:energy-coupling factor transporter ATP-binding protein EcfA2
MIQLQAVRLINWYHFADETFRLTGSCLFLGDNGSGKSTILDAIQLVLVADMTQVRFNKAANESSHRNLYGYVRYKLGSEDEAHPNTVRFGRGSCTSYVLLQFSSGPNGAPGFVAGVALEASEHDSQVSRLHFLMPGLQVDEVPVLADPETVRPLRTFRTAVRDIKFARWSTEPGEYQDELRQRLGTLPKDFHRLIARTLAFRPLGDIREFVFAYLLDPRPVDTATLQANLEHYKRMEAQAKDAEVRITALDEICALGDRIAVERHTNESHQYVYLRADVDLAITESDITAAHIRDTIERQERLAEECVRLDDRIRNGTHERDRIMNLMLEVPEYRIRQRLEQEVARIRREISDALGAETATRRALHHQGTILDLLLGQEARDVRHRRAAWMSRDSVVGATEEPAILNRLRVSLDARGALGGRDLGTWTRRLDAAHNDLLLLKGHLEEHFEATKQEGEALHDEQRQLEAGQQRYPKEAEALLHLLRSQFRGRQAPRPLCELLDVPNDRWRDAVEGYLNTRRFDVLVDPRDFPRALGLYERHKQGYALPGVGPVDIAGVGLVDIEKMQVGLRKPEKRSLAEQVTTEDPRARVYVDYVLGDIMCCENEQELRQHRSGITDTVMVYRNHVARQTAPHIYQRHYIGAAARVRRRQEIEQRLAGLSEDLAATGSDLTWVKKALADTREATRGAMSLPDYIARAETLPNLRLSERAAEKTLESIDSRQVENLDREQRYIQGQIDQWRGERDGTLKEQAVCATQLDGLNEKTEQDKARRAAAECALTEATAGLSPERLVEVATHYTELKATRTPIDLRRTYDVQYRGILTRIEHLREQLVELKTAYCNTRGFAARTLGESYQEFVEERDLWRNSRLPEYLERIGAAKKSALEQLADDIIFKLRENLIDVHRQIRDLNDALKAVAFGTDRYEFTLDVNPEHRDFHQLIMDAGHFGKESLFGNAVVQNPVSQQTLQALLDQLIRSEASKVKTELEAKADYREYFDYDLRIHHPDGTHSRYSRTSGDKSGGETQNPYYVAIFASLYRLYRQFAPDRQPACGLVLLDEAFSKMDEYRIAATLQFARALKLQLIMATPKERSELVIPLVESSLYIHRDPQTGAPTVLTYDREFLEHVQPT